MHSEEDHAFSRAELQQRSVTLTLLLAGAVLLFLFVAALTRLVHRHEQSLADRATLRGNAALAAGRYNQALEGFKTALLYARDDERDSLGQAEALLGLGHIDEAEAYLLRLRDKQPENGGINLALARIAVQKNRFDDAEKYYHCAIYAVWQNERGDERRAVRRELVDYLLRSGRQPQAQAELMAMAAGADPGATTQLALGSLFLRAGDAPHALIAYRAALRADRHNEAARAGLAQAQQIIEAQRNEANSGEDAHE